MFDAEPPPLFRKNVQYLEGVLLLMELGDDGANILLRDYNVFNTLPNVGPAAQRREDRKSLAWLLGASIIDVRGVIVLYRQWCPLGRHSSFQEAVGKICRLIGSAQLRITVTKPAMNKWIKLQKPLGYIHAGVKKGYLQLAFDVKCRPKDDGVGGELPSAELIGLGDDGYNKQVEMRFSKGGKWLNADDTPIQQGAACTILAPAISLMGEEFANAAYGVENDGVLQYILDTNNPVLKVVNRYCVSSHSSPSSSPPSTSS